MTLFLYISRLTLFQITLSCLISFINLCVRTLSDTRYETEEVLLPLPHNE